MKIELYNRMAMNRRTWLKGAAAVSAVSCRLTRHDDHACTCAKDDLRAQILQIPGVGKGSPTDADWQKVGEMCLAPPRPTSRKASSRASS